MSKHDNKSEQTCEAFGTWRFFNTAADKTDTKRILMLMPSLRLEGPRVDTARMRGPQSER